MKPRGLGALLMSGLVLLVATAAEHPTEKAYVFDAIDVRANTKWGEAPIVSAGRWGLQAETEKGIQRFGYSSDFRLRPIKATAREIVEVRSFDISLAYARKNELEARAMSEAQRYQIETDAAISNIVRSSPTLSDAALNRIAELNDEYEEFEEGVRDAFQEGDYESNALSDSIQLSMELRSPREIEDAYCVVIVRYYRPHPNNLEELRLTSIGQVRRVGRLPADAFRRLKVNLRVPPGFLGQVTPQFHLFSGNNENLATTIAPGLRMVSQWESPQPGP